MPLSTERGELYPGDDLSVSELLYAAKKKLRGFTFDSRIVTTMDPFEIGRLEQDTQEVLRLLRSIKNNFAPINRIPPELFSTIPQYRDKSCMDKSLIALTHVCQGWREVLTTYSSLWTRMDCTNAEKTRVYIKRSKSSPLEIALRENGVSRYQKDALLLVLPHISRVASINVFGGRKLLQDFTETFSCPVPILRHMVIRLSGHLTPVLWHKLFDGNLSSLCTLSIAGVIPRLPCESLSKLTTLLIPLFSRESLTPLLDIFANAPLLSEIKLGGIPDSYDAPPGRVVSLPCLKTFTICTDTQPVWILLSHLIIPAGASLTMDLYLTRVESMFRKYIPNTFDNLQNISCISSISLDFGGATASLQLSGPSGGGLLIRGFRDWASPQITDEVILRSLDYFALSGTRRATVRMYKSKRPEAVDNAPHHILDVMKDLRTLFLNLCNNRHFILALNPDRNPSRSVVCPRLEEFIVYVEDYGALDFGELTSMAEERALRGARLRLIRVIHQGVLVPGAEAVRLREHVAHVDYRFVEGRPEWDSIPVDWE